MSEPHAPFLYQLTSPDAVIVPREEVEKEGNLQRHMIGMGPFRFVRWDRGLSITLERNPDYWQPGVPYVDGLQINFQSDASVRLTQLLTNNVDLIQEASLIDLDLLQDDPNVVVVGGESLNYYVLTINTTKPPFNDVRVRQAIAHAIDRQAIVDLALNGYGYPLTAGPIPPFHWAALDEQLHSPYADPDTARKLLAEAGVPNLSLTIQVTNESIVSAAAQVIQQNLQAVGIRANIRTVENSVSLDNYRKRDYDVGIAGFSGRDDPNDQLFNQFYSEGPWNWAGHADEQLDALLLEGLKSPDRAVRKISYDLAQKRIVERVPFVMLYNLNRFDAHGTHVKGFVSMPNLSYRGLKYVWLENVR